MAKNIKIKLILLMMVFLCCLLVGCNESSSSSDKTKSADVETTWYRDADGDGYGDPSATLAQQSQPDGYVAAAGDCADYDAEMYPGAPELCDGKDNNCDGTIDENACDPNIQTISGQIANVSQIQPYLRDDSYLQLVLYPADGQMVYTTDGQGRRIYPSNLAIIDMPADGAFSFEATELSSGDYVVAAQLLASYDVGSEKEPVLSDSNDQPVVFSVPADDEQLLDIDLGKVSLPVPAVLNQLQSGLSSPSGVSATDGAYEDRIRVTWNASNGATSYEVFRAKSFSGQKIKIDATAATFYDDMALPCGIDYYYWIKALNTSEASELFYSDLGFVRCPLPDSQPSIDVEEDQDGINNEYNETRSVILDMPTGLAASDGTYPDKIHITWKSVSKASAYDVYRCCSLCGKKIKLGTSMGLEYEDFDVVEGMYYYWLKANNDDGTSEFSMPDTGYIMVSPPVPAGVTASDGTYLNKVLVKWNKVSTASKYEIYRANFSGAQKRLLGETNNTQFYDMDQQCSKHIVETFVYSVKAINAAGVSDFSEEDSGYIYRTLPDPVWIRASEGVSNCVEIKWNTIPGAKTYDLYRADTVDGEKMKLISVNHPLNKFLDSTVTDFKKYYYWVKAIDAKGVTGCEFGNYDIGYSVLE